MGDAVPEVRVPEIVRRYIDTTFEDFHRRDESLRELGEVLELIVQRAAESEEILDPSVVTDGVDISEARTPDRQFECEGKLWLLGGGGESFSLPLQATFQLSEDLRSVSFYEVKIADAVSFGDHFEQMLRSDPEGRYLGPEFNEIRAGLDGPKEWTLIVSKGNPIA